MKLYKHQEEVLEETKNLKNVAYYLDMGLGKTFVGAEKMKLINNKINLIVCQKSKVNDWLNHYYKYYGKGNVIYNLTNKKEFDDFINHISDVEKLNVFNAIGVINYDLVFRRKLNLKNFTLMLDESSIIQNEKAKRTKAILKMLPSNVILLSGTPVSGKYENLWSQAKLLGWDISLTAFQKQYIEYKKIEVAGIIIKTVDGYKNVDRLKRKFRENGAVFMKTEDVIDLPSQNFITVNCNTNIEYKKFLKNKIITINDKTLVGDRILTFRLYLRILSSQYNKHKLEAFRDILESTNDRLIVFYNFNEELSEMMPLVNEKHTSIVNGSKKDLDAYENYEDSVTFVQYQAGAMGINLQKANKIIYFSPTESSELFEQSKKRIHRIGQNKPCFYYLLTTEKSIDEKIYEALEKRRNYTDELFKESFL